MKLAKFIGVAMLALGLLLLVVPAVLPTTIVREGPGSLQFDAIDDGCGSAIYAALEHPERSCGQRARERLFWTTSIGLLLIVGGVVMGTGSDDRQSSRLSSHR